ncbi:transcription factor IBH1-like [Bidens hawaiensis]|uniref:transcription factor IBH1-like n=1 Tax=Bidens hawaiensis TaxID=980011 RepID=UPI00404A29B3
MAHVTGSRRAWSRVILRKIRNRRLLARNKRVDLKNTRPRHHPRHVHAGSTREFVDPIGDSGQEVKLRKLVPGSATMDACGLLDETADYIKCLATQVEVMRTLVDFYSTF